MASRWDKLKDKVPDAPAADMTSVAADKSFLQRVDDLKTALAELSLPQLMNELTECNEEWDKLEARRKELNIEFEALGQLIKSHFEAQGVTSVRSADGQTFYQHREPLVGVKAGRRDEAEAWVLAHPDLDYLWSIQPQSLASWVKERLDQPDDEAEPIPEFLSVELKTSIRTRKGS